MISWKIIDRPFLHPESITSIYRPPHTAAKCAVTKPLIDARSAYRYTFDVSPEMIASNDSSDMGIQYLSFFTLTAGISSFFFASIEGV